VAIQMESFNSLRPLDSVISQKLLLDVFSSKKSTNGKTKKNKKKQNVCFCPRHGD
jgi:hypothetical protein